MEHDRDVTWKQFRRHRNPLRAVKPRGALILVALWAIVLVSFTTPGGAQSANGGRDQFLDPVPADELPAADDPHPVDDAKVLSGDEAYREDAEEISSSTGRSPEEVVGLLRFQEAVQSFIGSLSPQVLSTTYAGAAFSFPDERATLYFKGDVPDEIRERRDNAGLTSLDLVGGMESSLEELIALQNAVHDIFVGLGFTEVVSVFDVRSQVIGVDVAIQSARPALQGQALRDEVLRAARSQGLALRAEKLEIVEYPAGQPLTDLDHSWGGAGLRAGGRFNCTSGFTVRRASDGREGTLTAGHCEGLNEMEENTSGGGVELVFSAPWAGEHIGTYGDVEWHTTSHDDFPEFWSTYTERRPVQGRIANSQISQDAYVCHFGRSSGYSCGNVSDVNSSGTFYWAGCGCNVTAYNMVDVAGTASIGGDSGGPWFFAYTAWGIHHGTRNSNGHSVFSKIQNAESAFGVSVEQT